MAKFLYRQFVEQTDHDLFDRNHRPIEFAPRSGIYRCMGCGREVAVPEGGALPGYGHHAHGAEEGPPRWRLIVYADHRPDKEKSRSVEAAPGRESPQQPASPRAELVDAGGIGILDRVDRWSNR
jgi:hypothetical protein